MGRKAKQTPASPWNGEPSPDAMRNDRGQFRAGLEGMSKDF